MIPLATLVRMCLTWSTPGGSWAQLYTLRTWRFMDIQDVSGESGSPRLWVEGTHWMRYLTGEPRRSSIPLLQHIWRSIWASSWPRLSLWMAPFQDAATSYGHLKTTCRFWASFWIKKNSSAAFVFLGIHFQHHHHHHPANSVITWPLRWNVGHVIWIGWEMHWSIFFANCLWKWDKYWILGFTSELFCNYHYMVITSTGTISGFVTITLTNIN